MWGGGDAGPSLSGSLPRKHLPGSALRVVYQPSLYVVGVGGFNSVEMVIKGSSLCRRFVSSDSPLIEGSHDIRVDHEGDFRTIKGTSSYSLRSRRFLDSKKDPVGSQESSDSFFTKTSSFHLKGVLYVWLPNGRP